MLLTISQIFRYAILTFVVWLVYKFLYAPYMTRRFFAKQGKVVAIFPKFVPVLGDFAQYIEYEKAGKFKLQCFQDLAAEHPEAKMIMFLQGGAPKLAIHDQDLAEKIFSMVPHRVDRGIYN